MRVLVRVKRACVFLCLLTCAGLTVSFAPSTEPPAVLYRLEKGTTFQRGCFDPCDCPIMEAVPLRGSFRLTPAGSDPLFDRYTVKDVLWVALLGSGELRITGAGTYRIGGEFARQHQLSLDLQVNNDPVQHFDSGLVVGGSRFPGIDVVISIHGQFCFDTVMDLHAAPWRKIRVGDSALSWDPSPSASGYDLVKGRLSALRASRGDFRLATEECLADDTPALALQEPGDPPSGEAFWFALREVGSGADGSYDEGDAAQIGSRDPGIAASSLGCP